ncbi:hypothetical protein GCM10009678_63140 [Actinomadura kijaniata]|uniref:Uncharacterized protein n=1 Tax=Actinomadura namibiensis TaxID=182080 RepID=A0A7W3LWT9_ACTNM|nr:hypothetical protein [Actinomadura namibiensis]
MVRAPARCGTRAGYNAHRRRGEAACEACQEAVNKYMRGPTNLARRRARGRALSRLALIHPDLYAALYSEELTKEGVEFPRPWRRKESGRR